MTHRTMTRALGMLAFATGVMAGCSVSSHPCPGQAANLVGTYDLLAYDTGGTTFVPPQATGVLRLHTATYGLSIVLPGPTTVSDTGSYSVCGASGFNQQSLAGQAQFSGVYILVGDTLSLSGRSAGSIWLLRP